MHSGQRGMLPLALALSLVLLSFPAAGNSKGVLHKGLQRHATIGGRVASIFRNLHSQQFIAISAPIQGALRRPRPFAWQTACALCMLPARAMSENSQCYDMLCALSHSSRNHLFDPMKIVAALVHLLLFFCPLRSVC